MGRIGLIFIFTAFVTVCSYGQSDNRWTVSTDAKSVAKGDDFSVTFQLENAKGSNFTPPDFQYFKLLRRPTTSTSSSNINGRITYSTSWTYLVKAERTGKFWIKPASIVVDGKKLTTKKIQIEVTKGRIVDAKNPQQLENLEEVVFLRSTISDSIAVVGQPLVYELKLYWVPDLLNARLMAEPPLKGFYQEDNPRGAYRTVKEAINGLTFRSKTLYKGVIYPQQEGKLEIGSYRIIADVEKANSRKRRSIFSIPEYIRLDLKSRVIPIEVVPLPGPAPADFSGAVGSLEIGCQVDQRVLTTDDAVTMTITLSGEGDTKQMQAPVFESTDSIEVYPPKLIKEESYETAQGVLKEKAFEYVLLPKFPGTYQVSPTYSYFDAEAMTYEPLFCDTIRLRVSQGSNLTNKTPIKDPVIEDGLTGIIKSEYQTAIPSLTSMSKSMQWTLLGIPILGMMAMLGIAFIRKNSPEIDEAQKRRDKAREMAFSKLKAAKLAMDQYAPRLFYDELSKGMHGYLEDKIGIPLSSLNEVFIREKLASLNLEETLVEKFMGVLKNCQMALFAGKTGGEAMQQSYVEAGELIETLEERLGAIG